MFKSCNDGVNVCVYLPPYLHPGAGKWSLLIFLDDFHWADSVLELRCPSVCLSAPKDDVFFRPLICPQIS